MISLVDIDWIAWPSDRAPVAVIPSACTGWYLWIGSGLLWFAALLGATGWLHSILEWSQPPLDVCSGTGCLSYMVVELFDWGAEIYLSSRRIFSTCGCVRDGGCGLAKTWQNGWQICPFLYLSHGTFGLSLQAVWNGGHTWCMPQLDNSGMPWWSVSGI